MSSRTQHVGGDRLRVLGSLRLEVNGKVITARELSQRQAKLVLTALALEASGVHRDVLGELLWGDAPPPSRDQTLSAVISRLRHLFARTGLPVTVSYENRMYRLERPADFVDVDEASMLTRQAGLALVAGDHAEALATAMAGIRLLDEPMPLDWDGELLDRARRRVERLIREASATVVDAALVVGDTATAVETARRHVERDPLDEGSHQRLLRALAAAGDRAGGLRAYEQCRSTLVHALGVDPSPVTEALYLQLLGTTSPPQSVDERLAGLPLPALLAGSEALFRGRDAEIAALHAAWRHACATNRPIVVALVGRPGSGRRTLAARVAQDVLAAGGLVLAGRAGAHAAVQACFVEAFAPLAAALADDGAFRPSLPPAVPYVAEDLARALRRTNQPTLLVLHDADELDDPAIAVLEQLRSQDVRLLVVVCVEQMPSVADTALPVPPLDPDDVIALVDVLLGDTSPTVVNELTAASERWPGPLLELLRERLRARVAAAADRAAAARLELGGATFGLARHLRRLTATNDPVAAGGDTPYKGLSAYGIGDAANFHGRQALIGELVALLGAGRIVAVVGASGSGKSSLVRAGVLSALSGGALPGSDHWQCDIVVPGAQSLELLAEQLNFGTLTKSDVIFIDQMEEIFTVPGSEQERSAVLDAVVSAAQTRRVVLAMRADFYERCATHRPLAALVQQSHVLVGPMLPGELRCAIEQPAAQLGVRFEPLVVDALIAEIAGRAGALPLLSTALETLWNDRRSRVIGGDDLTRSGGVIGAVARLADAAFHKLDDDDQRSARRLLLRLCAISEHGDDVARQATLRELVEADRTSAHVLDVLVAGRLVVVDHDSVRLAHEALLREWPRLRSWLDDDRSKRVQMQQLRAAAQAWDTSGRQPADLYRDVRLSATDEVVGDELLQLPLLEQEFLDASRAAVEADAARTQRRHRRVRIVAAAVAVLSVVAATAAVVAVRQRDRADRAATAATVERLVVQASSLRDEDTVVAALLAIEANNITDTVRTRGAILDVLDQQAAFRGVLPSSSPVTAIAADAKRSRVVIGDSDGAVAVWNIGTMDMTAKPMRVHGGPVRAVAIAPDGGTYATGGDDGSVQWWDAAGVTPVGDPWTYPGAAGPRVGVATLRFAVDGSLLVVGRDGGVVTMSDPRHPGERQLFVEDPRQPYDGGLLQAIDPGATILVNPGDGGMLVWRIGSPPEDGVDGILFYKSSDRLTSLAAGPNGEVIAVADERRLTLWNGDDFQRRPSIDLARTITSLTFSENGARLAAGLADGTVAIIDVASGTEVGDLVSGSPGATVSVAFGSGGQLFVGTAAGVAVRDLDEPTVGKRLPAHGGEARTVTFFDDGRHLAAAGSGPASVWAVDSDDATPLTVGRPRANAVAELPDGRVAIATSDTIIVFDAGAGSGTIDKHIVRTMRSPYGDITAIAANDAGFIAVGSRSGGVALLETDTGNVRAREDSLSATIVESVAFLDDRIAAASADGVHIWNPGDGLGATISQTSVLLGAQSLATSPDGALLAVGASSGLVLLDTGHKIPPGEDPTPLLGVHGPARGVAWSPDGSTVAAAFDDGSVFLVDRATRTPIGPPLHVERATGVAWSPNGELLAATGLEGDAIVFAVSTPQWRKLACSIAGRTLTLTEWQQYLPGRSYRPNCDAVANT